MRGAPAAAGRPYWAPTSTIPDWSAPLSLELTMKLIGLVLAGGHHGGWSVFTFSPSRRCPCQRAEVREVRRAAEGSRPWSFTEPATVRSGPVL